MYWRLRFSFGVDVVPIDVFLVHLESIPNFYSKNPIALHLRCVIAHKMLFSSSIWHENIEIGTPYFHGQNSAQFRIWCIMDSNKVACLCIWCVLTCLCCYEPKPSKASSMLMRVVYTGKPMSLRWHGLRQSHRNDLAHNIAWICTYSNRLELIPTLQGQMHS